MIIGLSGYAQTGKDTIAKILVEEHGYTRLAFADALKDLALRADPVVAIDEAGEALCIHRLVEAVGWEEAKGQGDTRPFLQRLGAAAREVFGENIWVNVVERQLAEIDAAGDEDPKVVITDVRYPNELEMLRHYGGFHVRVIRDGVTAANDHVSELALDEEPFDAVIDNSASLSLLRTEVQIALYRLRELLPIRPLDWSRGL